MNIVTYSHRQPIKSCGFALEIGFQKHKHHKLAKIFVNARLNCNDVYS